MGFWELSKRSKWIQYNLIIVGTFLMATGINLVYEPLNMVTGGVTGFAIVLKSWTSALREGGVPIWLTNLALNIPLFLLAIEVKGKQFVGKTLFATACFTVALYIIPVKPVIPEDYLIAAIFGAVLNGVGLGLVFSTSTSTGGTDLLGAILQKLLRQFSVAQLLFVIDSSIVLLGAVVFGVHNALYAVIAVFITTKVMGGILEGINFAKLLYIITDNCEEIAGKVLTEMGRGATSVPIKGMYSNNSKNMLLCVVSRREVVKLMDYVTEIDPKAFMIISDVREVMGEGFIEYGHK